MRTEYPLNDDAFQSRRPGTVRERLDAGSGQDAGAVSLWGVTAPKFSGGTELRGDVTTDVAIIGAGVAGLSTALHLRELGVEAVVLEADQPGSAATGASGGILAPEFARDGIAKACRLYGKQRGERLARMVGRSAGFTFDLISRHQIECEVQQRGFVSPGRSDREIESLRADGRAWQSLGFPVEFLDAGETADAIGSHIYNGALQFESGGALNPLAYATGLANALHKAGVPVFISSAVRKMERIGGTWQLRTQNACVSAKRVVLAANGGNAALHPSLRAATLPLLVHEYATRPVSGANRRRYFGSGVPYTDRGAYVFTARLDDGGRVISAIPEVIPKWDRQGFVREAARRLGDVYSMRLSAIEFTWSGTAYLNPSLLPAVYLPEGDLGLIAIQACNGRGLGVNTILGSEVAELVASGNREAMATPLLKPQTIPMHPIASKLPKMIMSLAQMKDRWRAISGNRAS
jgi:glycine/D-amino acid oxidase-like deaminating enzyme